MVSNNSFIRNKVLFFGHVQGVGFRAATQRIAGDFQVRGYVRNMNNGSVELVAEGKRNEVDAFFETLCSKMQNYIDKTEVKEEDSCEKFDKFEIR